MSVTFPPSIHNITDSFQRLSGPPVAGTANNVRHSLTATHLDLLHKQCTQLATPLRRWGCQEDDEYCTLPYPIYGQCGSLVHPTDYKHMLEGCEATVEATVVHYYSPITNTDDFYFDVQSVVVHGSV